MKLFMFTGNPQEAERLCGARLPLRVKKADQRLEIVYLHSREQLLGCRDILIRKAGTWIYRKDLNKINDEILRLRGMRQAKELNQEDFEKLLDVFFCPPNNPGGNNGKR